MRPWWRRRGARTRIVLSAAVPLAVALVVGTVAVAFVFVHGRFAELDRQTSTEAAVLRQLLDGGQLPTTLPLPLGSPLLAQVLDTRGVVLAAAPSASRIQPLVDPRALGVATDESRSYAGAPLRTRALRTTLNGEPVLVVVAAPLGDVRRALHALLLVLVLVVPALVALMTMVLWQVAGSVLRPVEQLRAGAAALLPDPDGPLPTVPVGDDEIARLGQTLNDLLTSLQALVRRQRRFVADAAHELRSPLTGLTVQLDVALAHPEHVDLPLLLADLRHDLDRLSILTEDLLLLARWDEGAPAFHPLDLRSALDLDGPPTWVEGDAGALCRVVANLISNADRYAGNATVSVSTQSGLVIVDVDDDGPGIALGDRDRVFDRWVRLDDARSRSHGGAGLGLALSREIARSHGGDITVHDAPSGGARFRVVLPLLAGEGVQAP